MIKSLLKTMEKSKLLTIGVIALISSLAVAGGLVVFHAGDINGTVTISDQPAQTYDVLLDGTQCPCNIDDTLTMTTLQTVQVQHNIVNNEPYAVDVDFSIIAVDSGLSLAIFDGTMSSTTTINIPSGQNKWVILEYTTDDTVSSGDTLTSTIKVDVTPS
jgi:hypothetical protein